MAYTGGPSAFGPSDLGYLEWAHDPTIAGSVSVATAGQLNLTRIPIRAPRHVTNICMWVGIGGATLTSGQNFAGLWSSAGALLSLTTDQSTAWASAGEAVMPLASAQDIPIGYVYAGWWCRASTRPQMACAAIGVGSLNAGTSTATSRFSTADSGLTTSGTAPSTLGTKTASQFPFWAALS